MFKEEGNGNSSKELSPEVTIEVMSKIIESLLIVVKSLEEQNKEIRQEVDKLKTVLEKKFDTDLLERSIVNSDGSFLCARNPHCYPGYCACGFCE